MYVRYTYVHTYVTSCANGLAYMLLILLRCLWFNFHPVAMKKLLPHAGGFVYACAEVGMPH